MEKIKYKNIYKKFTNLVLLSKQVIIELNLKFNEIKPMLNKVPEEKLPINV